MCDAAPRPPVIYTLRRSAPPCPHITRGEKAHRNTCQPARARASLRLAVPAGETLAAPAIHEEHGRHDLRLARARAISPRMPP